MTPCSSNHPPILHDEFWCPLCVALDDNEKLENELADRPSWSVLTDAEIERDELRIERNSAERLFDNLVAEIEVAQSLDDVKEALKILLRVA